MKQQICILGSTGSIGTQALDVIKEHGDRYEVYALTANSRWEAGSGVPSCCCGHRKRCLL